jgi:hypothetical protein
MTEDLRVRMKLTNRDDMFLLSLIANMLLTISIITLYDNIKQLRKEKLKTK